MRTIRTPLVGLIMAAITVSTARAQDKAIFALNWIPSGNHFGVFAAKERGFFRGADLDVDIQRGNGSGDTLKRVAIGTADIGIADAASVIIGRTKGLKVKQIASIFDTAFDCIFYLEDNGITQPKDLEGRNGRARVGAKRGRGA